MRIFIATGLVGLVVFVVMICRMKPTNERAWSPDQAVLPHIVFNGSEVHIQNIRNIAYRTLDDYTPDHYDRIYDLNTLNSVWFMVERFPGWPFMAHTLLSFGFSDGSYVAISVEVRKEHNERYSAVKGLFRQYELMYVVGDERDLLRLRTNFRKDPVFLYPVRSSQQRMQELFVSMLKRANELRESPEFYNTLTNTCTTNIVKHINTLVPKRIPWSYKVLLPGYVDELAFDLKLIDAELPLAQAKEFFRIDDVARSHADHPSYSALIRERMLRSP